MSKFPLILTALRKERKLSQKVVAADLNISQALLSHYEKGVRECSLDLLVTIADYFGVSCDYLLGCTNERRRANVSEGELSEMCGCVNSIMLTFGAAKDKKLAAAVEKYLILSMYNLAFALNVKAVKNDGLKPFLAFDISELMKKKQIYNIATLAAESNDIKKVSPYISTILDYSEKLFGTNISGAVDIVNL